MMEDTRNERNECPGKNRDVYLGEGEVWIEPWKTTRLEEKWE